MIHKLLALIIALLVAVPVFAGELTPYGFFYKPKLTTQGATERAAFDAAAVKPDARLGKEIWVGDPGWRPAHWVAMPNFP